jgi:hypothetical protein
MDRRKLHRKERRNEKIMSLYSRGWTYRAIADAVGCTHQRVGVIVLRELEGGYPVAPGRSYTRRAPGEDGEQRDYGDVTEGPVV